MQTLKFIKYIFIDLKATFKFKIVYFLEKIIKTPFLLYNSFFKKKITIPYILKKDYIIINSDWIRNIKWKSWNDYIISTPNEYWMRKYFFGLERWVFLDIWAHIGKRSIAMCNKNINIKAYAFEPNTETFNYLKKNVSLNNLDEKIQCFNIWISNKIWILNLDTNCNSAMCKLTNKKDIRNNFIKVNVASIDEIIEKNNISIKDIKLIKIDTEWHEYMVIKWMNNLLLNCAKDLKIICEVLNDNEKLQKITSLMSGFWFIYKTLPSKNDFLFYKK